MKEIERQMGEIMERELGNVEIASRLPIRTVT
jgi:hypothetical protein